ncbi:MULTISPECIES: flagellar motor protein [Thermodesulfovibrio]|uniref:Chemotaxis MotA protein n=2 Tax=Thermodesulfovibrio yellowstonii TaxID=28262 RepID=B5YK92_THEYD|nr:MULTISPECIES: flagellar motor protein [Thermodesulfovibrio]ACI21187.1 chemotaxis MotA protein [Thermodesulfovibrio yellowstonii DSM 11347]MDI6865302.1 flagellar motor protein [Thermodesulfovibrio yellowstonii]GLI53794.1 chemotaxis protein MotA [Thermodesulfovibrio islandicus]
MDLIALLGLIIGIGAVIAGNIAEGGTTAHLIQAAAAIIVFGGTFGAVILSFPFKDIVTAFMSLKFIFLSRKVNFDETIDTILDLLVIARKRGLLALQEELDRIDDSFLRRGITYVIDGVSPNIIKESLNQEIYAYEEIIKRAAKVYDSAGGYAPTIGIIGAILGLIHVLKNVADPSKIGIGIATAFVATIYGVGSANLIFIPIAKRIVNKLEDEILLMELMIEGILGIEAGMNPYFLRAKLESFVRERQKERI